MTEIRDPKSHKHPLMKKGRDEGGHRMQDGKTLVLESLMFFRAQLVGDQAGDYRRP